MLHLALHALTYSLAQQSESDRHADANLSYKDKVGRTFNYALQTLVKLACNMTSDSSTYIVVITSHLTL